MGEDKLKQGGTPWTCQKDKHKCSFFSSAVKRRTMFPLNKPLNSLYSTLIPQIQRSLISKHCHSIWPSHLWLKSLSITCISNRVKKENQPEELQSCLNPSIPLSFNVFTRLNCAPSPIDGKYGCLLENIAIIQLQIVIYNLQQLQTCISPVDQNISPP